MDAVLKPFRITANQDQSPLLQLPEEIRIRIYEFAIEGNLITPDYIHKTDITPARVARYRTNDLALRTFRGVVLSCRAIKAETELLFYSKNIFYHEYAYGWSKWAPLLDANKRAAIRTIQVPRYYHCHTPWTDINQFPNLKTILVEELGVNGLTQQEKQALLEYAQNRKCQLVFEGAPSRG